MDQVIHLAGVGWGGGWGSRKDESDARNYVDSEIRQHREAFHTLVKVCSSVGLLE